MSESRMPRITGHSNVRLEPEGREGEGASCLLRPLLQLAEGWAQGGPGSSYRGPRGADASVRGVGGREAEPGDVRAGGRGGRRGVRRSARGRGEGGEGHRLPGAGCRAAALSAAGRQAPCCRRTSCAQLFSPQPLTHVTCISATARWNIL